MIRGLETKRSGSSQQLGVNVSAFLAVLQQKHIMRQACYSRVKNALRPLEFREAHIACGSGLLMPASIGRLILSVRIGGK